MKKQVLLFLLALLPFVANADSSGTCGKNLTWTYVEATKTLTISGSGAMANYTSNGNCPWYSLGQSMKTLIIDNGVTSIGYHAFLNCSGLTSVNIPNSVTSIGSNAFAGCTNLLTVTLNSNTIVSKSYSSTSSLIELFGNQVTEYIIDNSVNSIGNYAFYGCNGLKSVTIGSSVTSIGNSAFYGCSGLTSVNIPNSVTYIDESAFCGCSELTAVTIGSSVTSIGDSAFNGCSGLTSVNIPNSVTYIGAGAFYECDGLTSVNIPNSVTYIGAGAFYECDGLTSVNISDLAAWCNISFYNYETNPLYYAHHLYLNGTEVTDLVIPNSVTSIGDLAFSGCSGLTSVNIPNSVTSIGYKPFDGCTNLSTVTLNSNTIVSQESWSSSSLQNVFGDQVTEYIIGSSVKSIGSYAFYGCSGLTSVTIPNSVTSIGSSAFYGCSGLTSVNISDLAAWCNISFGSNPLSYAHHLYLNGTEVTDLIIPNSVTAIGNYAFYGCSGLTSVNIPNSVTSIGFSAFYGCSGLTSVNIPNSVTSIGSSAFSSCTNLLTVTLNSNTIVSNAYSSTSSLKYLFGNQVTDYIIGNGVTAIGNSAFNGCTGLTSVTIPNSVTSIGNSAFNGCTGLTSATIPNSVTSIGNSAFNGCTGLTSVHISDLATWCNISFNGEDTNPLSYAHHLYLNGTEVTDLVIPNSVTSIGNSAFNGCTGLTSVTIPDDVTSIGESAFFNCSSLSSVNIGKSVNTIGKKSFSSCSSLSVVTCYAQSIPNTDADAFLSTDINKTQLYVPASLLNKYEVMYPWCYFGTIRAIEGDEPTPSTSGIAFHDNQVKSLCLSIWDNNHDGQLSYEEAAVVTDLGTLFEDNTDITSFDELKYFTGLTAIGENAFFGCSNLTSITLPTSILSIGSYAFSGCKKMTTFTIPQSVNDIGSYAFRGCSGLTDVYCKPLEVPTTPTNAFYTSNISNATLHVVSNSYNLYKDVEPWKNFKNMMGDVPEPCRTPTIMFVNNKLTFTCETTGVEFTSNILCEDQGELKASERDLTATYLVSVYATKDGFEQSATATATLCWINAEPMQGVATGLVEIPAVPVLIKSNGGVITIEGVGNNTLVSVYTTDGMLVGSATAIDRKATIATTLTPGTIAIVKIGEKAVKVAMH